jgi:uncharacterized protein with HEPN domain
MLKDDQIRFRHMLDAAKEAISFTQGRRRSDLESDRMLLPALTKDIEILGEAASKVSEEGRKALPSLPWSSIVAMRNRLIMAILILI